MPLPFTDLVQSIADRFDRSESAPAPKSLSTAQTGNYGERVAAAFLRRHGYKILTRNYRTTRGEIDLICRHKDALVFVEVRTRASTDYGRPGESIDTRKQDALRRAAQRYLELLRLDNLYYRFDAVEVILNPGVRPVCTLLSDIFA